MKLKKIKESLNLEVIAGYSEEDKEVEGAYIGDLLSVVMSSACLLYTSPSPRD